ncbi:MAG: YihY/virulence factor BrkB family protein [Ardenticatenaceae bacterium]|nr:YihY/virulence factor BrkB family protein [Ardenticatenaceae bacterium]HBY94456.1 hypothetical protein [Chloroflexota bacterium]
MGWLDLLKEAWREYNEDKAQRLGAALAYYAFFSLFPLILLLIALVGYALALGWPAARDAQTYVLNTVERTIPAIGGTLRDRIQAVVAARGALTTVGIVTLLWSASNIFAQLNEAFDIIFDVEPQNHGFFAGLKSRLLDRALSVAMVLGVVLLLLAALVLTAVLNALATYTEALPGSELFWTLVNFGVSFALTAGIFAVLFKVLPARYVRWRAALAGGVVTALGWEIGEQVLALYLARSNWTEAYGIVGSVMALLIWIYYTSQILFLSGELTSAYNRRLIRAAAATPAAPAGPPATPETLPSPPSFFFGLLTGVVLTVSGIVAGIRRLIRRLGR